MEQLFVRGGSTQGFAHRNKHINNQDSWMLGGIVMGESLYQFGAVFDGCTGKKGSRNEVGSALLAAFFKSEIPLILQAHTPIDDVPNILYQRAVGFLGSIARSAVAGGPDETWSFVESHLLSTVIGFLTDGQTLVVFVAGDGVLVINDKFTVIDQENKPKYMAYHLLDRRRLPSGLILPTSFDVLPIQLASVTRFCVSSDGLSEEMRRDPGFVTDGIWEYESTVRAGLQWWLNKESMEANRFSDDCTAIAFERRAITV